MKTFYPILLTLLVVSCEKHINNTELLLSEVKLKYSESWLNNIVFNQKTSFYKEDSLVNVQNWREALEIPNKLHIRFGKFEGGNGMVFKNDSQYVYRSGKMIRKIAEINNLQYFAFDVYKSTVNQTLETLKKQGFDSNIFRLARWQGDLAYVIGAEEDDNKSNQLWFDKKTLMLVRIIYMNRGSHVEAHLNNYNKYGHSFVAEKISIFINKKLFMLEEYSDVKINQNLDRNVFDLNQFSNARF